MSYKVKLNIFEGPFDLLVYLLENAEMNIYDIRVSEITAQYLEQIELMKEQDIVVGADFLVLAATLIELKTKMLLPRIKADGEEEEDPRTELVEKLLEYKKFKGLAAVLEQQAELASTIIEKPQEDLAPYTDEPDEFLQMDLDQFIKAFKAFIMKKQKEEDIRKNYERVEREKATVASKIGFIKNFFKKFKKKTVRFKELLTKDSDKYDEVLTFMSVLEMVKNRTIKAEQEENFSDIELELQNNRKEQSDVN